MDDEVAANEGAHALVSVLLAAARRATGAVPARTRYYAFVSDDNGNVRVFLVWAMNLAEAEREARNGARDMNMTRWLIRLARLGTADRLVQRRTASTHQEWCGRLSSSPCPRLVHTPRARFRLPGVDGRHRVSAPFPCKAADYRSWWAPKRLSPRRGSIPGAPICYCSGAAFPSGNKRARSRPGGRDEVGAKVAPRYSSIQSLFGFESARSFVGVAIMIAPSPRHS